jgi:hypothetical protein
VVRASAITLHLKRLMSRQNRGSVHLNAPSDSAFAATCALAMEESLPVSGR